MYTRCVRLSSGDAALLPVDSSLATVLRERQDWKLAYHDRMAVLFLKTNEEK